MEFIKMEVREAGDGAAAGECDREPPKKYSWAEVRQAVHDLRKDLSSLSTMVPMAICFRKLSCGKTRVYFLRTPQNGWETLLYTDVLPTLQPSNARLDWKPLIKSNVALGASSGKCSKEEQLLWERQRVAAWGIASYELHQETGRVLFPCASSLFVAEEGRGQSPPILPRSLSTGGGAPLTPAICPSTARLVAHAARGDIWLAGDCLGSPTRLTYACKGKDDRLLDDPLQAGVPCYVTQEEFSRYTGFWWQPKCDDDIYRIVYEEVDESDVKIFSFPSSNTASGDVDEFRFPRAGTPNAKSVLKLVTFRLTKSSPTNMAVRRVLGEASSPTEGMDVTDIRWFEMRSPLKEVFPWFEYLARVGWTSCGQYVWAQILDRKQQRLELVLIPLAEFNVSSHYSHGETQSDDLTQMSEQNKVEPSKIQVLVRETAPDAWINVHDIFYPLSNCTSCTGTNCTCGTFKFIWASEETGFLHLYMITANIQPDKANGIEEMLSEDENNASGPNIISKEAITSGDWEVMGRKIWVDETRDLVYFVGLRETPLERHLYVASLSPSESGITLLTTVGHSHTVDMDDDCTVAVITSSNISSVPVTRVYSVCHTGGRVTLTQYGSLLERPMLDCLDPPFNGTWDRTGDGDENNDVPLLIKERSLSTIEVPPPQIYSTRLSCGMTAYCTLWRSGHVGPRPTVLHVYGGPEVQIVTNSYKGIRQLRMHMLAARGFTVVSVDSRGSKHRGRAWEAAIRGKMGQVELDDQVEVLQWLAKETGCIDMERVAIHGWSYGGYLSLLGLATRPHIFKVCVAGAPVTSWRLYDTAYTERYMGSPSERHNAYSRASVIPHAPFFPDKEGRLLIIHGLADENVHFCHTAALLSELVRLGKPHRVQVYPGERHSLRTMHAAKHYEATLLHFLHENL
ncbi:dipeptidyl peptidase 9 isoform X2 [Pieris napi]|uniref:dipeptidyl peptidase 9 isoform X2 n=1 Tax=Pieris napi TaxID=78633 RepID=UPI001FBA7572|nr:dipeptidyl peptidase 9 isoform X2 [Pieris napi]